MSTQKAQRGTIADKFGGTSLQACIILAVGLIFALGVARQLSGLNGIFWLTNWEWKWRNLGILKTAGLCLPPFLLISWVLWREENSAPPARLWLSLSLLGLSNYLLQVLGMLADPRGFGLVGQIVSSAGATSYFTDATAIHRPIQWLSHFQDAQLNMHSATHPPGPILFYYVFFKFFKLLGTDKSALIGGCAVGLLGSVGVVVMYTFAGLWTEDRKVRLTASSFYALLPAIVVFFPEFDQVYPIFLMLLILFWVRALGAGQERPRDAVYAGAILFVATFFAYNLFTVGIFLFYFGVYWLWRRKWALSACVTILRTSAIVLGICVALYGALWLAVGYHPIASFRHALSNEAGIQQRSYFPFPLWDPYDFLLGLGMIALPILLLHLRRLWNERDPRGNDVALTLIGLGTVLSIDLSGLLRGEAMRLWIFLLPLVAVPVAIELCRLPWTWRISIFTLQWWILVSIKAKMTFLAP